MLAKVKRHYLLTFGLLALVFLVSGCGGGGGTSILSGTGRSAVENELRTSLAYFCDASDALDKEALERIFSPAFEAKKEDLNPNVQAFMEERNLGDTLDYNEQMMYFDELIRAQEMNSITSQTTIVDFTVEYVTASTAITAFTLHIESTVGNVEDRGRMSWVKEAGVWRIKSVLKTQ